MREIPQVFRKYGYTFKLLKRKSNIVLYEQRQGGVIHGYEVHIVRKMPPCDKKYPNTDSITKLPEREVLASTSGFGIYAWSFQEKVNAENKFDELLETI